CDLLYSFVDVERVARHANARTYSMGVALSPCSLPQTLRPIFLMGEGEMEIGMGLHGEPGVAREPLRPADAVTYELLESIIRDMNADRGVRVAVL
ncbi:dihydroxyacetone kinase subunit DhaK, partial [Rhizobium ruizarguesonis]